MNLTAKRIGSLFLSVCMIMTMLPTVALAETGVKDSGAGLGISGEITAFADLDEDIAVQTVETGTPEDELNLPDGLIATVTNSEVQELSVTAAVYGWTSDPAYDGDTEGDYIFTPVLDLPEDITLAEGVTLPEITVTVEEAAALHGAIAPMAANTPATVTPADDGELENALKNATPQMIEVNTEITLNNELEIGANHTLSISSGNTIFLADNCKLTIPEGTELTVSGGGKFVCHDTSSGTISVAGTLTLDSIGFEVKSAGSQVNSNGKLNATDCNIKIANLLDFGIALFGEMEITGGKLEISNSGDYTSGILSFSNSPIFISDCKVKLNSSGSHITGIQGNLYAENSKVYSEINSNDDYDSQSIDYSKLTFDHSEVTLSDKNGATGLLSRSSDSELKIMNGSTVCIQYPGTNSGTGVFISPTSSDNTASLIIDDSVLELYPGGTNELDLGNGAQIKGENYGKIIFHENSEVCGVANKIKDRGVVFTSSYVTVGAEDALAAPNAISAGEYIWDGMHFSNTTVVPTGVTFTAAETGGASGTADSTGIELTFSEAVTGLTADDITITDGSGTAWTIALASVEQEGGVTVSVADFGAFRVTTSPLTVAVYKRSAVTGTMNIGGGTVTDLTQSASGTGWEWDADTATLTLDSSYLSSNVIEIQCGDSDNVDLVLAGNVTIRDGSLFVLYCYGNLNIKAGTYTLDLSSTTWWPALVSNGNLVIESGTIIATGADETNGIQASGDVTISGSANVTATSPGGSDGWGSSGIMSDGNVNITTSGEVHTSGYKNGIYADGGIIISSGTVTATGENPAALIGASSGVTVNGGMVTTNTKRGNGDVYGNLTVSGANANVTITGSITNGGDLTVSSGNVSVTGTVAGSQNLTGGTAPTITTTALPSGTIGTAYSQALAATGTAPITWSIASGSLPDGLTLEATGLISGTPATEGVYIFSVMARNAAGSIDRGLSIQIYPAGTAVYSVTFDLNGGTAPAAVH